MSKFSKFVVLLKMQAFIWL